MKTSISCVIRDNNDAWQDDYGGMIGFTVPITVEFWALYYAMKFA